MKNNTTEAKKLRILFLICMFWFGQITIKWNYMRQFTDSQITEELIIDELFLQFNTRIVNFPHCVLSNR